MTWYCSGVCDVGYNYGWIEANYSNWIASNNVPSQYILPSGFDPNLVDDMFHGMAQGNAKVVRIWLFPDMLGVDIDPQQSPQALGLHPSQQD
jgi:hypothetical protein